MIRKILFTMGICSIFSLHLDAQTYNPQHVKVSSVTDANYPYKVIYMDRGLSGKKIKAKYFAAKDYNGTSVPNRFLNWSQDKNLICVTSGTYMSKYDPIIALPVGLTVDNGVVVNKNIADFDGLVIVYATGGVVATNLEDKNLKVQGGSISGIPLDLKGNSYHLSKFLEWCEENEATVFQTHLLAYNDILKISPYNSSPKSRERRFLAVGYDEDKNVVHCIVHSEEHTTLYEGSKKVLSFLNGFKDMEVIWMINLDTGAQNTFKLFDENGTVDERIKGTIPIDKAINLLVYYYQ
ncbi:hypothetical protein GCM10011344_08480 [Dokdonia pacifica]|uniref:Phosphodiester glycosidase domain-containing protein n=1 Tax=Dokdonia pacifica TaxID=1627892 RepID=A0A238YUK4_9FLAO|nr:hypothetical protein [Dokdonia pacifica]GGG10115.1 hypothetical protein GCM10011344_08480 [Dokdonia pacifica]SNR74391.1 hypothetical protein SAMN06265376_102350 [Dokdonia pacifica]